SRRAGGREPPGDGPPAPVRGGPGARAGRALVGGAPGRWSVRRGLSRGAPGAAAPRGTQGPRGTVSPEAAGPVRRAPRGARGFASRSVDGAAGGRIRDPVPVTVGGTPSPPGAR